MNAMLEQMMAEEATGIRQQRSGLGKLYAGPINRRGFVHDSGVELDEKGARSHLEQGGCVSIPNAGAGSYLEAFKRLGFSAVEVFDTTSSAGDWTFLVFDGEGWHPAWQENRYPRHGFNYSVDFDQSFETVEHAIAVLSQY